MGPEDMLPACYPLLLLALVLFVFVQHSKRSLRSPTRQALLPQEVFCHTQTHVAGCWLGSIATRRSLSHEVCRPKFLKLCLCLCGSTRRSARRTPRRCPSRTSSCRYRAQAPTPTESSACSSMHAPCAVCGVGAASVGRTRGAFRDMCILHIRVFKVGVCTMNMYIGA